MKRTKFRLLLLFLFLMLSVQTVFGAQLLIPGGQVIGLEVMDNTVTVAAFDDTFGQTAKSCGLQVGDRIVSINGTPVHTAQEVKDALRHTDGQAVVSVLRCGKVIALKVSPAISSDGPRLGVYLKQGITGVGTVTWYDPETDRFGALGHGVNDPEGNLVAMTAGKVYSASVITVRQGQAGNPGQLMSSVTGNGVIGALEKNVAQGVFGTARLNIAEEKLPVGSKEDIHTGSAVIRSTVNGNRVQEYSVEILKIYPNSGPNGRNLLLKVTDPDLLNTTGGIVQGMSGSPIIQDGKLVGAVTHVLVNDPTTGYGIFIENMLDAAA